MSQLSACELLKKYKEDFFAHVYAKYNLHMLCREGVIPEEVKIDIDSRSSKEAKEIMYEHLVNYANVRSLRLWCTWAKAANGYPEMQNLGEKMGKELN